MTVGAVGVSRYASGRINPVGQAHGRLTIVSRAENDRFGRSQWNCICECGKGHVAALFRMTSGHTKSCGCIRNESNLDARLSAIPAYISWSAMKQRCYYKDSKQYDSYGGRGITVCDRWNNSFNDFLTDMGHRPDGMSIERNDVNGNYEPSNCRWATKIEQARNRRNNIIIVIGSVQKCVSEWCEILNIPKNRTFHRISAGWPPLKALFL